MTDINFNMFDVDVDEPVGDNSPAEDSGSLANDFLTNIPEADRQVVEKYVKDWDAGVTKRFQEIRGQYKPYEELGASVEDIQQAILLYNLANERPEEVMEVLKEWVESNNVNTVDPMEEILSGQQGQEDPGADPFAQKLSALEQNQQMIAKALLDQREAARAQAEKAAIDNMLSALHTKHGEFDDDYVLLQIQRGAKPDEAVVKFNEFAEGLVNSRTKKPAVPVLPGGGGTPKVGQVDKSSLADSNSRIAFISKILEANAAANQ